MKIYFAVVPSFSIAMPLSKKIKCATLRHNAARYKKYRGQLRPQRGVALFTVMVIVLLSMLLALWASRSALLNEMIVGNDADYQRAYEAAQAMIQDAELDVRISGRVGGARCEQQGGSCNPNASIITPLPVNQSEFTIWTGPRLKNSPSGIKCQDGLCVMRPGSEDPDFWSNSATFAKWKTAGARYGQYTGAAPVSGGKSVTDNPILQERAWYWVEIGQYTGCGGMDSQGGQFLSICSSDGLVYRITAVALGLKPGTRAVLQETYINENPQ